MRRLVFILLLIASAVAPATADAHDLPQERTVLLEVDSDSLEAMVVYREPPGERLKLFRARYDWDQDGELTGSEATAAADAWVPHALQGLDVTVDGESVRRSTEEVKFREEHNDALSTAIYLEYDVSFDEDSHTVAIARAADAADFATVVNFQTGEALDVTQAPDDQREGRIGPYDLPPGRTLEVAVRGTSSDAEASTDEGDAGDDEPTTGADGSPDDEAARSGSDDSE